jgi:hypothetical protein
VNKRAKKRVTIIERGRGDSKALRGGQNGRKAEIEKKKRGKKKGINKVVCETEKGLDYAGIEWGWGILSEKAVRGEVQEV